MSNKIVIEYHNSGCIYDNGSVPTCSFCGVGADNTTIHEGDYSGQHICESKGCANEYMTQNIYVNPFEAKEVEIEEEDDE
jgi:hypothetical protein